MTQRLFVFFMALLLTMLAQAQEIRGVGNIRIGMSESEFLELPEIKSKNIQDAGKKKWDSNDGDVWKKTSESIVPESYAQTPYYWKIYTPDYVKYNFQMATGIKNDSRDKDLYDAAAEFYKGELIKIKLSIPPATSFFQFKDVLTEKYGKPTRRNNMSKVICQNGYGVKSEHDDGYITLDWGSDKDQIEASLMISNRDCGEHSFSSYTILHKQKNTLVSNLERKAQDSAQKEVIKTKATSSKL